MVGRGSDCVGVARTVAVGAVLVLAACGGGDDGGGGDGGSGADTVATVDTEDIGEATQPDGGGEGEVTLEDVAGFESVDRRSELLSELGAPDAFVITVDELGGEVSRLESWTYYEAGSQIDLIDGEILWNVEIDDLPDGSLLPLTYSPMEFEMLASVDDTLAALDGVDLIQLEAATAEFEVDGSELWAGEQLALAFVDDALVYVEAFALAPEEPEVES